MLYVSIVYKENKPGPSSNQKSTPRKNRWILYTDLCGPTRMKGLNGKQYFMLLVDDYIRIIAVFLLRKKSEAFKHF
jgi:hypothetical protein